MKRILSAILFVALSFSQLGITSTEKEGKGEANLLLTNETENFELSESVASAYLIEASTGKVIYAKNEYKESYPASVTKIMTLLLVCEALDEGKFDINDMVTISARAASMGGSQVFLEEGERISVEELIKSTVIASGNDAAVALAELCAGSEKAFVKKMNARATELGLRNTKFENTTGLDDTIIEHYSCAADIAKMAKELIKHEIILKYSSLWQDTIRNGEFTLTNTNRLVRYYDGCNGLKTGSTDKAGFCVCATAKRGNMQLIAVIMGAESSAQRNKAAAELLDYGFSNFTLYERDEEFIEKCRVFSGTIDYVDLYSTPFSILIEKGSASRIELIYDIPESLTAPITKNIPLGTIIYKIDGKQIGKSDIIANEDIGRLSFYDVFSRIIKRMLCG